MRIPVFPLFLFVAAGPWAQAQISPVAGPGGTPAPVVSAPAAPAAPVPPDTVVAEVDGKKYTAAEVDNLMKLFPPQQQASIRSDPKRAFGLLMLMRHLAQEAEKAKLDQQSPMKETLEFGRLNALSSAELNEVRNQQVKVTPDDEMKFYKEHPDRFREAKVRVIYVAFSPPSAKADAAGKKPRSEAEAKAKIEELKGQIDGGADFGKLARENSDDKESAGKDGDFGMIRPSSAYPEAVKTAVFALKAGQVSAPVRQPNGFYLLRVDSVTTQPYDQIRTLIYDDLKQKGFNEWWEALQKRYDVKVENQAYFAPERLQGRSLRKFTDDLAQRLPETDGKPISVRFLVNLRSYRGDILSGHVGDPIHGASHMHKREMILDKGLQAKPRELRRILIHEVFHFAWMRLGQPARESYTRMVAEEFARGARGELGWSAQYRKDELRQGKAVDFTSTRWRDYVCESFCDTAAWFFSGLRGHAEFTLSIRYRQARARWFREYFGARKLSI